jgi:hypothetical protein
LTPVPPETLAPAPSTKGKTDRNLEKSKLIVISAILPETAVAMSPKGVNVSLVSQATSATGCLAGRLQRTGRKEVPSLINPTIAAGRPRRLIGALGILGQPTESRLGPY